MKTCISVPIVSAMFLSALYSAPRLHGAVGPALDRRVAYYQVENLPIEDALKQLVGERNRTFAIGFEQTTMTTAVEPRITVRIEQGMVREILKAICSQDPRYEFSEPEDGVISVFPNVEGSEARAIMDLPLTRVDIDVHDWPFNLLARLPEFAPDLREYLDVRAAEYGQRTRSSLRGSPGVTVTTNVEPPKVEIHLRYTTVRGALNMIAAYTLTHFSSGTTSTAPIEPTGWMFWFQVDANAPTGLGGYPHWNPF